MSDFLKKSFLWLILAALVVYVVVQKPVLVTDLQQKYFPSKPCAQPIEYKIGTFDTRFGISRKDFLTTVEASANIWSKGVGKTLFHYNPNGTLTINLVYDTRQQATQQNARLQANVDKLNTLASSVKAQYASLEGQYKIAEQSYSEQLALLKQGQSKYNANVAYWNSRGGAPRSQYTVLNAEKDALIALQENVEKKRIALNSLADQIRAFIEKYNLLVTNANSNIQVINASAGEFEEGIYDPNKNEIDIYQFDTKQRLFRVLAHELGHSLGLDHNDNKKSIMYAYNIDQNEVLTSDDLIALKTLCGSK